MSVAFEKWHRGEKQEHLALTACSSDALLC